MAHDKQTIPGQVSGQEENMLMDRVCHWPLSIEPGGVVEGRLVTDKPWIVNGCRAAACLVGRLEEGLNTMGCSSFNSGQFTLLLTALTMIQGGQNLHLYHHSQISDCYHHF